MCLSTPLAPKLSDESDAIVRVRWGEVHMWRSCLSAKQPLLPYIESDSNNDEQLNLKKQYWCMCQSHCRSTDNTDMWTAEPAHQHTTQTSRFSWIFRSMEEHLCSLGKG